MSEATYSPEDNKLRLYCGRVPREEFLKLRAEGWVTLHKQREAGGGDFAATWTPERHRTALEYGEGFIADEDMGPAERAADRAERFSGYRDKRTAEATGRADDYAAQPMAHGYQNEARAERAAARHDRIADHALDAWSKAEYWQRRTAGVISHALYRSSPGVRMGRIKTIEAELRKREKDFAEMVRKFEAMTEIAAIADPEQQTQVARKYLGCVNMWSEYKHPRPADVAAAVRATGHERAEALAELYSTRKTSLYTLITMEYAPITGAEACALYFSNHSRPDIEKDAWATHYKLRLAYENQMLEAQGGRAAFVEMEVGGWIGGYQIRKVNKSNATGRVVSVNVLDPKGFHGFTRESGYKKAETRPAIVTLNIERLKVEAYRPPTEEDKKKLAATIEAEKAKAPKKDPCPLINPTDEEAQKLITLWNERRRADFDARHGGNAKYYTFEPCEVKRITQAAYSAASKGSYARAETRAVCSLGRLEERQSFCDYEEQRKRAAERGPKLCQIRTTGFDPVHVIILTDKPQKPLPASVWESPQHLCPTCGKRGFIVNQCGCDPANMPTTPQLEPATV